MTLPITAPNRAAPFEIRDYQLAAHTAVREAWADGVTGAMVVMATGTGKTATALSLVVSDCLAKGKRVAWLAHRKELVDQPRATVAKWWPEHARNVGIVRAEQDEPGKLLTCASVATLARSPHRVDAILAAGPISLVIVDEAHHSLAPTHQAAIDALGAPKRLGLTATAHRDDGGDLSQDWEIVYSYSIVDALESGALVHPWAVVERLPDLDLSRVSGRRDYDDAELGAELLRAGVVAHTVEMLSGTPRKYHRLPERDLFASKSPAGRSALVFCATVDQAIQTAAALREAGRKARHVSGKTPQAERDRLVSAFRRGAVDCLCNVGVFTEGTDLPRASVIVFATATRSWVGFTQRIGRGLRLYPDKEDCLIIDLSGATEEHSLIAAPVLIGGTRCPESPNGIHSFIPDDNPQDGAKCSHCERRVACGELLAAHDFTSEHRCKGCDRVQCVESETGAHHWTPVEDHKRQCIECGISVPDPMAGMLRKRSPDAVEADWVRVPNVAPETYVVDCGEHGLLFIRRQRPGWIPVWLRKGARKPRPLSSRWLRKGHVRAYADDIVRRAAKVAAKNAPWKSGRPDKALRTKAFFAGTPVRGGETAGDVARRLVIDHARKRALKTGICREL